MEGRSMPDDVAGSRKVLGDLTNSFGKRGLHLAPGKFVIGNGFGIVESDLEKIVLDVGHKKRVCRGPESLFNGAERIDSASRTFLHEEQKSWKTWMFPENKDGPKFSSSESHLLPCSSHFKYQQGNSHENNSSMKFPKKVTTRRGALNPGLHCIRGKSLNYGSIADRQVGDDGASAVSVPMEAPVPKEGFKKNISVACIDKADGTSHANCSLESSGLEFMKLNKDITQDSEIFTADLLDNCCTHGTGDLKMNTSVDKPSGFMHIPNMRSSSTGIHGNKSCSCNFCLKASFIWADLLLQDVRGRLAELGKSIRLAKTLAEKDYFREITRGCSEGSLKYSRMEFDLVQRWKSLFVNTENSLHGEGAEMQANLLKLKDLAANCKRDLETVSVAPSNLSESSDGSE